VLLNIKKLMGDVLIIEKFEEECMSPLWWVSAIRETTWKLMHFL
jgi:hypothetical protein